jgi:hypothetical protein
LAGVYAIEICFIGLDQGTKYKPEDKTKDERQKTNDNATQHNTTRHNATTQHNTTVTCSKMEREQAASALLSSGFWVDG